MTTKEVVLPPGGEWSPSPVHWGFVQVSEGAGYWMQPGKNLELTSGATLIFSNAIRGAIRASQLGQLVLHAFQVDLESLAGVVTLDEKQFLETATGRENLNFQLLPPGCAISERFAAVCRQGNGSSLRRRLQLLEVFTRAFDQALGNQKKEPVADSDARARLEAFLKRAPASAMLDLSFSDLVKEIRCTPRHLSRIFLQTVGMSFRQKQAEARLARARELLETTSSKIHVVAVESRYQSLSLFNFMFRKRFGVTPARWRKQLNDRRAARRLALGRRGGSQRLKGLSCN